MEKNETILLYPSPGQMGHLVSMVELAKLLLHHHNLKVTILVVDTSFKSNTTSSFISQISSTYPSISFHYLPQVDLSHFNTPKHFESYHFELISLTNPNLHSYLSSLASPPLALILDFFCLYALDVTKELDVPSYVFFSSNASCFASFLYLPIIDSTTTLSFEDLGCTPVHVPGLPPIPAKDMCLPLLDRTDQAYLSFVYLARRLLEADGIMTNTFEWLEQRTIGHINDGLYIHDKAQMPPVYCVGPLIMSERGNKEGDQSMKCMAWLDTQPKASVVFLCFGSMGAFSKEQLKEIAIGLENSNQRFLWVVRSKLDNEHELDMLLPEGFLDRTRERGFVVKSWAPQVEVLNHEAVGGFVTHLGWNSVLEATCAGVPMIGWPLYAEQKMNRVFVVDDMKLAVAMEGYDKEIVMAEEVERRVRELMEPESSVDIRKRIWAAKEEAMAALADGGASRGDLNKLVNAWRSKQEKDGRNMVF